MFHPRKLASAMALALGCIGVAHASHSTFGNVVVFGDSLSDNGNLHSIEPGTQQRFTTNPGEVAVELVAQHYGYTLTPPSPAAPTTPGAAPAPRPISAPSSRCRPRSAIT